MAAKHTPKVAIVHDWLVGGGAERVIQELHEMYPDAPIYTSYCTDEWRKRLDGKVVTGFLQHWPFSKLRKYVGILRIWWFNRLDLSGYDIIISSSGNGEAKAVNKPAGATHICYCHAPTHYYWRHYNHYLAHPGFGVFDPLARLGLRVLVGPLRRWDKKAAQKPDYFIANSSHTQDEIKTFYGRESTVVHPPIDIERFTVKTGKQTRNGFVTAGRQTPYKRTDLLVEACTKLNVPLTVIGRGPEQQRLVAMAGPTITFLTNVTDEEMPVHFASAKAFLFAAYEDFGVTPVEAMAAGTPVVAYRKGGAQDYVVPGTTGVFFEEQTAASLENAIAACEATTFDERKIAAKAATFAPAVFRQKIQAIVVKYTSKK